MKKRQFGFTLPEILIALAVIGALAALLFPVFGRVREKGRQTTCQNNLKQIYLGFQLYVQDSDAQYPNWWQWEKQIAPYVKNPQSFWCPSMTIHGDLSDYVISIFRFNSWNISFINPTTGEVRGENQGEHEAAIQNSSKIIMSWELGRYNGPYYRTVPVPASCGFTFLNNRPMLELEAPIVHSGGGNFLFADGHVKWLTPEACVKTECEAGPFPHSTRSTP